MPANKKQHYVPRFYLKRFSSNGKSIALLNIPHGTIVESAKLKTQCYKKDFYGKELEFENALSGMEGGGATVLRQIDAKGTPPIQLSEEHLVLLHFLLLQESRTKYSVDTLNEMHDLMFKHTFRHQIAEETDINLDDYIVGIENASQFAVAMSLRAYPLLLDLEMRIILNRTKTDFVTSDNPVAKTNPLLSFMRIGSTTGYASKGLVVYFPVAPDRALIFFDPEIYLVGKPRRTDVVLSRERDVHSLNALQACGCYENVYFRSIDYVNCIALRKKTIPFRRTNKANIRVFPKPNSNPERRSEIVMNFAEDIGYVPKLSCLKLKKTAKKWREATLKQRSWPGAFIRNEELLDYYKEFDKIRDSGEYQPHEFLKFVHESLTES